MRIWDIPITNICDKHLIAEHHELHCIYNIITKNLKGFSNHPETMRWRGKLEALCSRHKEQVAEMKKRGFKHNSPLKLVKDSPIQDYVWQPINIQKNLLSKRCKKCNV